MATATLRKQITGKPYSETLAEADSAVVASLERATSGVAALWTDDQTTAISVGGGSSVTTVTLAAGSGSDMTLAARGSSVTLNESGQTSLATTAQSLVGAINELVGTPLTSVVNAKTASGTSVSDDIPAGTLAADGDWVEIRGATDGQGADTFTWKVGSTTILTSGAANQAHGFLTIRRTSATTVDIMASIITGVSDASETDDSFGATVSNLNSNALQIDWDRGATGALFLTGFKVGA